jgi:hypothetical protein
MSSDQHGGRLPNGIVQEETRERREPVVEHALDAPLSTRPNEERGNLVVSRFAQPLAG